MLIKTIIVEDEPLSRAFMKNLLEAFCPQIIITGIVDSETSAVELIKKSKPDLVFLDIELLQGNGFEVLRQTYDGSYHVIFTTAVDHIAINAIVFSGADYVQKPIDIESLQTVLDCANNEKYKISNRTAIMHLLETVDNDFIPKHIAVNTAAGRKYLSPAEIIFLEESNKEIYVVTEKEKLVSEGKTFKELERLLACIGFLRVHSSFIINPDKISSPPAAGENFMHMQHDHIIPVSPKKAGLTALTAAK